MSPLYFEANYRNIFASDAAMILDGLFELTAEAPNIVNFVGTAFDRRGALRLDHFQVGAARIGPDLMAGYDLTIGTNLVAPLAGGSVKWEIQQKRRSLAQPLHVCGPPSKRSLRRK
ncbi:MAG: hypothetical protein WCO86_00175 [Planctomycetota bacterium]